MRIGIICAGDVEVDPFLDELKDAACVRKAMLKFYTGKIANHEIITLFCGACKVNAAIAAQIIIDTFKAELVINAGVAGGIDPALEIFDTVISTEVAYHDVAAGILTEFHPWMKSIYFAADEEVVAVSRTALKNFKTKGKIYWGRMVTGEAFIEDEHRQEIIDNFDPLSVDMETASIAHVCYVNEVPFIAIRTVTDTADHCGNEFFEKNCVEAAKIAKEITVKVLQDLYE